jgi:hypothetical protein
MAIYTRKEDKTIENWIFHPDYYNDKTSHMPKSIQNHVKNQLNHSKNMPIEDITQKHPVIENKILRQASQYSKKKDSSRLISSMKRKNAKQNNIKKNDQNIDEKDADVSESDDEDVNFELEMLLSDMKKNMGI